MAFLLAFIDVRTDAWCGMQALGTERLESVDVDQRITHSAPGCIGSEGKTGAF
jgi:hypothetical protein